MDILLDTHVFLWMINLDDRIPDSFVEVIREPENSVFLSTASLWEIIIKYRLGRLPLPESPATYVPRQRQLHRIESLPIDEVGLGPLESLPLLHRDPFDRLWASQALAYDMFMATVDPKIIEYGVKSLR